MCSPSFARGCILQLEIVALRHQLTVYQRTSQRPRINPGDRVFWSWLSRRWSGWRSALVFFQTRTVIAWQRKHFRDHWAKLIKHGRPGRPTVSKEIKALIRKMLEANVRWAHRGLSGSCANSVLMLPSQPWRSTEYDSGNQRLRRGGLF